MQSFLIFLYKSNNKRRWTYSCHLFAIFCELSAFSLVAVLWSKTLLSAHNANNRIIPLLVTVDLFLLVYVFGVWIDMVHSASSGTTFIEWATVSEWYRYMLLVEPTCILINATIIMYLGTRIHARLQGHSHFRALPRYQKRSIMLKLFGTMVVCCVCFLTRGGLEIYLYTDNAQAISPVLWYMSNMIVTLVPATLLLYAMRRTKQFKHVSALRNSEEDNFSNKLKNLFSYLGHMGSSGTSYAGTQSMSGSGGLRHDPEASDSVTIALLQDSKSAMIGEMTIDERDEMNSNYSNNSEMSQTNSDTHSYLQHYNLSLHSALPVPMSKDLFQRSPPNLAESVASTTSTVVMANPSRNPYDNVAASHVTSSTFDAEMEGSLAISELNNIEEEEDVILDIIYFLD